MGNGERGGNEKNGSGGAEVFEVSQNVSEKTLKNGSKFHVNAVIIKCKQCKINSLVLLK